LKNYKEKTLTTNPDKKARIIIKPSTTQKGSSTGHTK
jgi:hypothetical protein